jgi:muramoyltetrapeptide carboxypeptidase
LTVRLDRRGWMAGAGALLALSPGARARDVVKPSRLRPGDTVGLIEPAGFTDDAFDLDLVRETIVAMGLKPKAAPHLAARHGYLAGTDGERAADVNAMFADKDVKAIFAVRGGWGCARILPLLDWAMIRRNPKLLVGFSDITALHLAIAAKAGFTTIHGPNAASSWGRFSWDHFRSLAFDGATPTLATPEAHDDRLVQRAGRIRTFRPGVARGRLLGGNLTVLAALMGTPFLPDFSGAILFIEDVGEQPYRIDRMLTQLALGGVLGRVKGVIFGQCTDCGPAGASYGGFTLSEVLQQHLQPLGIPAFQGGQFGHVANQYSLPLGVEAEMDASAGTIRLLEPAVS